MRPPILITLTGPSGSGKSHLQAALREHGFPAVVSTTTRAPRSGEQSGIAYHFVSREQFLRDLREGRMVEHVTYDRHLYGLSARSVEDAARDGHGVMSVVVEPNGAAQIRDYCRRHGWTDLAVFVNNPRELLVQRLLERLLNDIRTPHGPPLSRLLATAARRVVSMFDDEQRTWVAPAYADGQTLYDLVFDQYDAGTQDAVAGAILARADALRTLDDDASDAPMHPSVPPGRPRGRAEPPHG